ncbi:glutamine synthetase III [Marispirochaeta sp.]|uniref:glutamine synthetase III family protein n=1 Tax=Marispirochaeta sp. TaxID=2038653 RepID=UPI0029C8B723|nr:glutamine synthetase III [Marispirochaeta sp.]
MERTHIDFTSNPLTEIYGCNCFNDAVMRERVPKTIYKIVKQVQAGETELRAEVAEVVANAMKDWAIEKGATHYTHWFQPLTGLTAEKHDSFISPTSDGKVIMEFSGKELIQGEPDASSFPSGGLRATFEARGYTAWDTTSPAFLKEDNTGVTLYIPTAFISYHGEALDKKVPLLRSMEAINKQVIRVLRALGNETSKRAITTVGPEQEYFLVDAEYFNKRPDLMLTGRTVFGSMPAKGQEMDDHYFGSIKERVADFMRELNYELWKLGISAKTQHNEVAPSQFELATIFNSSNVATDTNQLVMETMKKVASRHKLVCLLHEKPFAGVNGSGKHNNWSIGTDDGQNLLEPGDNPQDNAQFILFVAATIKAVDKYARILRMAASNAGNDHRLGANEAPPAIISIFLGDQLQSVLENLADGNSSAGSAGIKLELGVTTLPKLPKDITDRNRTSPFAFTGNKFEFRMVPSSESIAGPNVALNTAVAEILSEYADELEKTKDKTAAIQKLVKETWKAHKRVIFNGNGYCDEWIAEAEKRGLPNIKTTVEAIAELITPESVALFEKHKVFTKEELESRYEVYLEKYCHQLTIEANVMVQMSKLQIFPAATAYAKTLADSVSSMKNAGADISAQVEVLNGISAEIRKLKSTTDELEKEIEAAKAVSDLFEMGKAFRFRVFEKMQEVRAHGDALETMVARNHWPFPTYEDLLFRL